MLRVESPNSTTTDPTSFTLIADHLTINEASDLQTQIWCVWGGEEFYILYPCQGLVSHSCAGVSSGILHVALPL